MAELSLNSLKSGKANASHTHTKSQITDFPTSLPANGGNADTVGGLVVDSNATANTIAARDVNGYLKCTYINCSRGDEATTAASYLYDSGDGWIRKKSLANVKAELGIDGSSGGGGSVAILTGTATSGTLPIPSGYTREQCKFHCSQCYMTSQGITGKTVVSSTGVVTTFRYDTGGSNSWVSVTNYTYNYIVIGVK